MKLELTDQEFRYLLDLVHICLPGGRGRLW